MSEEQEPVEAIKSLTLGRNTYIIGDGRGQVIIGVCSVCLRKNHMVLDGICFDCATKCS